MFGGGRHWKVLVLLMIQTGMIGMVVLGGDWKKDVAEPRRIGEKPALEAT